ncbi:hypothetical protein NHX12_023994 [Muraenolepis orangiensis]|uniref:C2H2-type domain-containing protein n=1 Tax=Muraenolepis orangiensis TaxID=630683 RepID=A0A9Q0END4_9TELE|nr:hypothetical protein NHX12_023994 [Muraenolepis orangiensis]
MEGSHSRLTTGELPGGQEHPSHPEPHENPRPKSPSAPEPQQQQPPPQKPHGTTRQTKQSRRTHPQRKRLKHQQQSIESDPMTEGHAEEATPTTVTAAVEAATTTPTTTKNTSKVTRVPCPASSGVTVCSAAGSVPAERETPDGTPKPKRERKPQRPGKYVCSYCGRACAKPSVLQKHIRSHTGERPYPCVPCGFSFKTKSNLYKHRKSHTHRVKAGLAFSEPQPLEEQATESEDEAKQLPSSASSTECQSGTTSAKSSEIDGTKDLSGGAADSYAVKKRLAMRLSRGKCGPLGSSDEMVSSSLLGSRGSTESGYFSRSESTEQSGQDSPPNTSAKSYAEIILGKYGRFGHLQRLSRHQNQQLSGEEEKNISFTVPKKQVIDHITKLITINEAVVDTSKIDSVKPRRFSLSRKSSSESQKSERKEPIMHKSEDPSYKNSGSITMGVPCEKFQHQSLKIDSLAPHTSTAPLLRSQSMPFATSSIDAPSNSPPRFRQSQSFEQQTPSQLQTSRRFGMLRRQPAIEIPELPKEDHCSFHSFHQENLKTTVPDHKLTQLQPYKSEACGTECKIWEGYKTHKQSICSAQNYGNVSVSVTHQKDHPQLIIHPVRPGAQAIRKRRKEESFESDDPPSSPVACSSPSQAFSVPQQSREESTVAHEDTRRPKPHTLSVIQHTSSFEKQDTLSSENTRQESTNTSPTRQDYHSAREQPTQQRHLSESTPRSLVHPHNVRVPEILVTEDSNMDTQSSSKAPSASKQPEKLEEFQWPQRSPTLAQLPIEKLPPKKKRLRLAELAQSSGESSLDSVSLPRSPSQDSGASYASSRSVSFEDSGRVDLEVTSAVTPLRRSRASHTLMVPGEPQHREMRRSASEQAPHDLQQGDLMSGNRSKSFDYGCLSPERSAVGWRERRKCLLFKHRAVRDPEEEELEGGSSEAITSSTRLVSGPVGTSASSNTRSSAVSCSTTVVMCSSPDARVSDTPLLPRKELFSQWKLSQNIQMTGRIDLASVDGRTVGPASEGSSSVQTGLPLSLPTRCLQHYPGTQGLSGAARAHYLPMSTGLKLEIPTQTNREYSRVQASSLPIPIRSHTSITINPELLRPLPSPTIAVRLQADTLFPGSAIYTTQSQTSLAGSTLPPTSIGAYSAAASMPTHQGSGSNASPESQYWSEDPLRSSGTGGNKRMLSPSSSVEFSPESQQQQKRVKEEEEESGVQDKVSVDVGSGNRPRPTTCSPVKQIGVSLLSLESGTCNSWCYLNYIKPNAFALDERRPSVYSSWSTGSYNPNPLGLSSRTALSLLQCKQSLGPTIYTTSRMCDSSVETIRAEDHRRPASTKERTSMFDINNNNQEEEEEDDDNNDAHTKGCRGVPSASPSNQSAGEPVGGAGGSLPQTPSAGSRRALFARRQHPPPFPPAGTTTADGATGGVPTSEQANRILPRLHPDPLAPPPRTCRGLLSHLPLHSQQPPGGGGGASPGLTIAIGGIHMIQPCRAPPYRPACDRRRLSPLRAEERSCIVTASSGGGGPASLPPPRQLERDPEEEEEEEQEEEEQEEQEVHGSDGEVHRHASVPSPRGRECTSSTRGAHARRDLKRRVHPETEREGRWTPPGEETQL